MTHVKKSMIISGWHNGSTYSDVVIETGTEYEVLPLNPRKLKHRGRMCTVVDFVPVSESHPRDIVAKVRFKDNNRIGRVDLADLVQSAVKHHS